MYGLIQIFCETSPLLHFFLVADNAGLGSGGVAEQKEKLPDDKDSESGINEVLNIFYINFRIEVEQFKRR